VDVKNVGVLHIVPRDMPAKIIIVFGRVLNVVEIAANAQRVNGAHLIYVLRAVAIISIVLAINHIAVRQQADVRSVGVLNIVRTDKIVLIIHVRKESLSV